jgi:hypothetical protein
MAGKSPILILTVPEKIMLNLDKLNSQVDLKSLDLKKLTKVFAEHQNTLIKSVLIIGSLFMAVVMFNNHRIKSQVLTSQISQAQQKLDAIKTHEQAAHDLDAFKSSIPKRINEFGLLSVISNYAKLYHVAIPSLAPGDSKDMGLYDVININFEAQSDNFKDMMLFLRKIEKSNFSLRVNSWSGHALDDGGITFEIDISAVLIHT